MTNTQRPTDKPSAVTFYVFRKDGSRNPDIKQSFLEYMDVDAFTLNDGFITLDDNTRWRLVAERPVIERIKQSSTDPVRCIISFQVRVDGNYAVARIFNPSKVKASTKQGDSV